jgi:uncharacterized protein involved in oxidation of intracellular sulfur
MKLLLILNSQPYGDERSYNALRLAQALLKADGDHDIVVFLMADAASCAKAGQKTPNGYYNIERMLKGLLAAGTQVLLCGACMDARGIGEAEIVAGARRSSMDELAKETLAADKVLVF